MWSILTAMAIGLAAPDVAAAQTVCRTDQLGAVICEEAPAVRPRARPPLTARTPGLARVQPLPPAGAAAPDIIPGWRQNAFGRTLLGPGEAPGSPRCRTDTLGNQRCP